MKPQGLERYAIQKQNLAVQIPLSTRSCRLGSRVCQESVLQDALTLLDPPTEKEKTARLFKKTCEWKFPEQRGCIVCSEDKYDFEFPALATTKCRNVSNVCDLYLKK